MQAGRRTSSPSYPLVVRWTGLVSFCSSLMSWRVRWSSEIGRFGDCESVFGLEFSRRKDDVAESGGLPPRVVDECCKVVCCVRSGVLKFTDSAVALALRSLPAGNEEGRTLLPRRQVQLRKSRVGRRNASALTRRFQILKCVKVRLQG